MKMNEKLDILIGRKNFKRVEFAEKIGVTYRAFAYYMSDNRRPRKNVMERICRELDTTVDFLLDDSQSIELTSEEKLVRTIEANGRSSADAVKFLKQSKGLFAGNSLSEKDKENLIKCLTEIYEDSRKSKK